MGPTVDWAGPAGISLLSSEPFPAFSYPSPYPLLSPPPKVLPHYAQKMTYYAILQCFLNVAYYAIDSYPLFHIMLYIKSNEISSYNTKFMLSKFTVLVHRPFSTTAVWWWCPHTWWCATCCGMKKNNQIVKHKNTHDSETCWYYSRRWCGTTQSPPQSFHFSPLPLPPPLSLPLKYILMSTFTWYLLAG